MGYLVDTSFQKVGTYGDWVIFDVLFHEFREWGQYLKGFWHLLQEIKLYISNEILVLLNFERLFRTKVQSYFDHYYQKAPLSKVAEILSFLVPKSSFVCKVKIHTCCLGGVNIAEAVKAKVAKIKIVAFILASEFKLRTNWELFASILSFYQHWGTWLNLHIFIVYGPTHKIRPAIFLPK